MKLEKISIEFTKEELEAIHYVMEIGVRSFRKHPIKSVEDWVDKVENIRKNLPITSRFEL